MKKITLLAASALLLLTACGQVESGPPEIAPATVVQGDVQQPQSTPDPTMTVQEPDTASGVVQEQPQEKKAQQTEAAPPAAVTPEPVEEPTEDIPSETVHAKTGYVEPQPTPEPELTPEPAAPADRQAAIDAANAYAAEHLEIQTKDADAVVKRIKNAGAIFRGPYSPVPLGDYMSGSNHVLPTGGTARFAAGLGVHTFMKPVEVIEYDEEGLKAIAARINAFAVSEDLPAHGECVLSRFVKDPYDKATLREQEKEAGLR